MALKYGRVTRQLLLAEAAEALELEDTKELQASRWEVGGVEGPRRRCQSWSEVSFFVFKQYYIYIHIYIYIYVDIAKYKKRLGGGGGVSIFCKVSQAFFVF